MSRQDPIPNIQRNLRALVGQFESVAEFCRKIGVNRQQFNKYLAGVHAPSNKTMRHLADAFGLSVDDFLLGRQEFLAKMATGRPDSPAPRADNTHFEKFQALAVGSAAQLKPFLGTYFRYHHSSIYPGHIVRAVTIIYSAGPVVKYLTVERFPMPAGEGKGSYSFFYSGICYLLGDRLFMLDYERRQENELTLAVLMPQYRTPMKYLFGLLTGVASTTFRQPFSSRVVLEKRSDDTTVRKGKLRQATVAKPGDPGISPTVARYFAADDRKLLWGQE
ncbi:MAG TPA: helix-turn-helix transcriptional regulator [Bordetella sp.]